MRNSWGSVYLCLVKHMQQAICPELDIHTYTKHRNSTVPNRYDDTPGVCYKYPFSYTNISSKLNLARRLPPTIFKNRQTVLDFEAGNTAPDRFVRPTHTTRQPLTAICCVHTRSLNHPRLQHEEAQC